ncbi:peptide/nickel transport system substrate-binding protein [Bosea sp. AK1]|uniref:ABC transporter substrate-binding protein n=1 Tax=Bosea sp. AK1 TaxID=2587160 RepID=UPI00115384E1|nr:ABC transporter substrate-binding protein [Bosea sp. AK1]TQI65283.1 peptide/nickel transport system substrate-binding protein [Bosea sp. AK1]
MSIKAKVLALALTGVLGLATSAAAKEIRYASQGDFRSMDPHGFYETFTLGMLGSVYEGLVRINKDLAFEPALAERWEQKDPQTWVFHIRKGVKFHDGSPFTADDVVFSLKRAAAPGSDMKPSLATIKNVSKVDEGTVAISTDEPNPILPRQLASLYILSAKWALANGAEEPADARQNKENFAGLNANGTGPFKLVERQPGQKTVFAANADWWDKHTGNVSRIVFTPITSPATRVAALVGGQVDLIEPVPVQDLQRLKHTADVKLLEGAELRTILVAFDVKRDELPDSSVKGKNPLKDKRVRQAIAKAIDEPAIVKVVMQGAATPTALLVGPGLQGYSEAQNVRAKVDLEGARKLLAEAGYAQGFELGFDCPNDRYVNDERICQAIVPMLARIGVRAKLNAQTKSKWFELWLNGKSSFYLNGWTSVTYDALNPMIGLLATRTDQRGTFNGGGYSNPELDQLLSKIQVEIDHSARTALVDKVWTILKEDVPVIPLHQQWLAWGLHKNVDAVLMPDGVVRFQWVKIN